MRGLRREHEDRRGEKTAEMEEAERGRQAEPDVGALEDPREATVAGPRANREGARKEERILALSLQKVTLEFTVCTEVLVRGKGCY